MAKGNNFNDFPPASAVHGPNNTFPEFDKNQSHNISHTIPYHEQPDDIFYDLDNNEEKFNQNNRGYK